VKSAYEVVFLSFRLAWECPVCLSRELKNSLAYLSSSSKPNDTLICHVDSSNEIQIESHYYYSIVLDGA
jgi:hypothetical protein